MLGSLLIERYNTLELFAAILLALLPGSRIVEILITVFEKKTGITVPRGDIEREGNE